MRGGGRLGTRGDRFFSVMTGNAPQMILGGAAADSLAAARKNTRSKLISHTFTLSPGETAEWPYIAPEGWILAIVGVSSDHDGGAAIVSPSVQVEFPDSNHPPLGWSQAGESSFVGAAALGSQGRGSHQEEPLDYLRLVQPSQVLQIMARRHATDTTGNRVFTVMLHCWEMARSWN